MAAPRFALDQMDEETFRALSVAVAEEVARRWPPTVPDEPEGPIVEIPTL